MSLNAAKKPKPSQIKEQNKKIAVITILGIQNIKTEDCARYYFAG